MISEIKKYISKIDKDKVIMIPSNNDEITLLMNNEFYLNLKFNYEDFILQQFGELMFYVFHDLEFGIGNWELIANDEYIKDSKYPGFVSGEFVDKQKDPVLIRKKSIERLKNQNRNSKSLKLIK